MTGKVTVKENTTVYTKKSGHTATRNLPPVCRSRPTEHRIAVETWADRADNKRMVRVATALLYRTDRIARGESYWSNEC